MWLLVPAALAAPQFVAERSADVELAAAAWAAASTCTGREAPAHPEVRIERTLPPDGHASRASVDDGGLAAILLTPEAPEVAVVRGLAAAWATTGPDALVHGRGALLADCIARAMPDRVPHLLDDRASLTALPDLRTWTFDPAAPRDATTPGLVASARLLRVIAQLVPQERLWADTLTDWAALEALLAEAGDGGARVRAALDGGAETQRAALGDPDQDALPSLLEELSGTDPARWDSDGDGWWDGAPAERPERAVPLPRDGTPVCVGWRAPKGEDVPPMKIALGSALRGADGRGEIEHTAGDSAIVSMTELLARHPGGSWVAPQGDGLLEETRCASTPRYTVRSEDKKADPYVAGVATALEAVLDRSDALLGPPPARMVVRLGGDGFYVESNALGTWSVRIGQSHLDAAHGKYDTLAATAVAMFRTRLAPSASVRTPAAAGALARVLAEKPPARPPVDAFPGEIGKVGKKAEKCPGGWPAMLETGCARD